MNPKGDVSIKKSALTPALSPRRGRNGFRVRARSRRWIRGGSGVHCAKFFRGNLSPKGAKERGT
jgi:hypothetical protein